MYSHVSISAFSLLASLIASIDAYPTQYLAPSSSETLSISNQPQTPLNLYTTTSLHPSHAGILNFHPPSFSSSSTSSTLPIPFTLTSTCPQLHQSWTSLTSNLLSDLHLLYPSGPTSSPYYTFSPGSSSGSSSSSTAPQNQDQNQDTYTISTTTTQPSTQKSTSFKTTLYISITPSTQAGVSGITKEEWKIFLRMLGLVNVGMSEEMKGMGWGKLMGKRRLGPSDVVFPPSSSSYPKDEDENENENEKEIQNKNKNNPQKISFAYSATWIYYGITIDETGKEILRECSQIPLSAHMPTATEIDSEGKNGGNGNYKDKIENEMGSEEEEDRWKIDL
ncbi:8a283c0f-7e5d-4cf0-9212-5ef8300504f7 [Sclerotinia trifoliorum]|uniref:8a283c0f-7e5d-4cf0-9212-5ef8300504f7 n=1 Tax=Sclerotinia trifoliorum TaxID=28548 RepID=A0A8H2VW20_9HELO|nr:8a283c0f-7e5d-4cf0-9212-5ef8300504f7 [Sclerotinia trifoliorum]